MRQTSAYKHLALPVLLATLLLRAAIPEGYMPAAVGSGLFAELCPTGMPAGFFQAITGADSNHHHGSHDDAPRHYDGGHCPIGHLLSAAVAVDVPQLANVPLLPEEVPVTPAFIPAYSYRSFYHSRDPPV